MRSLSAGVLLVAVLASLRAAAAWTFMHARLVPDFGLYVHGGTWFYPSPLGRLLGWSLGADGFAMLAAAASGALVVMVAELARRRGGSPIAAALLMALLPLGWVTVFAGVDSIALAFFVAALLYTGRPRWALVAVAIGLHFQLAPFALLLPAWTLTAAAFACFAAVPVLLAGALSDYGPLFGRLLDPVAALPAFAIMLLILGAQVAVLWPWLQARARVAAFVFVASAEGGLEHHVQVRYGLVVVAIASASVLKRSVLVGTRGRIGWRLNGYARAAAS